MTRTEAARYIRLALAYLDEHPERRLYGGWLGWVTDERLVIADIRPPTGPRLGACGCLIGTGDLFRAAGREAVAKMRPLDTFSATLGVDLTMRMSDLYESTEENGAFKFLPYRPWNTMRSEVERLLTEAGL
jgi:hypothetical protein